ncbi:MAG TPA: class I SAM-dependent methyltransferase [Candidatus Saccharimonadales bacterium]|jgi:ubiquinone/menaquinone biosynthesis C-methylase UbiE
MTNAKNVKAYYNTKESKLGYILFLRGAKHFGYYERGDKMFQVSKALRKMERKIGKALDLPAKSNVLDAGSGMGTVSRNLVRWFDYSITGIDILDFNLAKACREADKSANSNLSLHYLQMDYHNLSFKDSTFDGVYTTETFVHASDPAKVLSEFYRVLKPGGKLVQLEYSHDPYDTMSSSENRSFEFVNRYAAMPAFDLFEHGVHEKLIRDAGFKLISSTNHMKNIEPMLRWFMLNAWLPVKFIRLARIEHRFVNAISAVDFWKLRHKIHVKIIVAEKLAP